MARDLEILEMPQRSLVPTWEQCVRDAVKAKVAVEDEVAKATRADVGFSTPVSIFLTKIPD
jgi:ubiquitin carboxyl-terminal hydrolase L5